MTAATGRATRALAALFALLTAVQLTALLGDATTVVHLTKPALMPVLAGWALMRGGPWPLPAALLCGCGGDVLLQIGGETAFLAGMGCFAAGHLCYLALFARAGRAARRPVWSPVRRPGWPPGTGPRGWARWRCCGPASPRICGFPSWATACC
ncbi:lysoplasmalogenase family protein [Streptomyces malaysiensis subsp. malaysiensis]